MSGMLVLGLLVAGVLGGELLFRRFSDTAETTGHILMLLASVSYGLASVAMIISGIPWLMSLGVLMLIFRWYVARGAASSLSDDQSVRRRLA